MRLLVCEVHKLRYILEVAALLAEFIDATLEFMHHKAGIFEGVDIAVYGTIRSVEALSEILDSVVYICRHQLHQL